MHKALSHLRQVYTGLLSRIWMLMLLPHTAAYIHLCIFVIYVQAQKGHHSEDCVNCSCDADEICA